LGHYPKVFIRGWFWVVNDPRKVRARLFCTAKRRAPAVWHPLEAQPGRGGQKHENVVRYAGCLPTPTRNGEKLTPYEVVPGLSITEACHEIVHLAARTIR